MTFTGMMVLVKICEPLDAFRSVLLIVTLLICAVAIAVVPGMFGIVKPERINLFFLIIVVLVSYFVASVIIRLVSVIKIFH